MCFRQYIIGFGEEEALQKIPIVLPICQDIPGNQLIKL
jgi:hypothetical protein